CLWRVGCLRTSGRGLSITGSFPSQHKRTRVRGSWAVLWPRRRSPPRLFLEINISEHLTVGVAHNETGRLLDGPGRREAAGGKGAGLWKARIWGGHHRTHDVDCELGTCGEAAGRDGGLPPETPWGGHPGFG